MKLNLKRLLSFLLALMLAAPGTGMYASAAAAMQENEADLLAQASIVSSEPVDGIYTMGFSVTQNPQPYYENYKVNKVIFVFSYDSDLVIPVDPTNPSNTVDIANADTSTKSPFIFNSSNFPREKAEVMWKVDENSKRTIVRVAVESVPSEGISMKELTEVFSFSYKMNGTGKQGMFQIESDSNTIKDMYPVKNFYQSDAAGILISNLWTNRQNLQYFNPASRAGGNTIILTEFSYPGCAGNEMDKINIYCQNPTVSFPEENSSWTPSTFIAIKQNADGVRIPFTDEDKAEWSFVCQNEKVEKLRQEDKDKKVDLIGDAPRVRKLMLKTGAYDYHYKGNNYYDLTVKINGITSESAKVNLMRNYYNPLTMVECVVTGEGMKPYTYYFPLEPDDPDSTVIASQGLCVIPNPQLNKNVTYIFDFRFRSDAFDEEPFMPQGENQFQFINIYGPIVNSNSYAYYDRANHSSQIANESPGSGPIKIAGSCISNYHSSNFTSILTFRMSQTKEQYNQIILEAHTTSDANKVASPGKYTFNLKAITNSSNSNKVDSPKQKYTWSMDFFLTDIAYTWPDRFTDDTPLTMKPDQTYQELLDELKSQGTEANPFFAAKAALISDSSKTFAGEVTVLEPDKVPVSARDNYVTFRFTVTDEGDYKGKIVEFRKLVQVGALPTEAVDATITKVDGKDYDNKPIELEVTKAALRNAQSLQDIGFPGSVTLAWSDKDSTAVTGSDLKFDASLDDLKALSIGDTKTVNFVKPGDNITLTNSLSVKVKVVPTGLGGGAAQIGLPAETTWTYNGKPQTPEPTVTVDGSTLVKDQDYTVSYENNVNAGTAKVIVTGKGDYTGKVEKEFTIAKRSLGKLTIKGNPKLNPVPVGSVLIPEFVDGLDPNLVTWEWLRENPGKPDEPIAAKHTYVPVLADAGHKITVKATPKDANNFDITSTASCYVDVIVPVSGRVYIQAMPASGGDNKIGAGATLKAVITPEYPESVQWDYQWKINDTPVAGATNDTYTLPDNIGSDSQVTVTVTPKAGAPASGGLDSSTEITTGKEPLPIEKVEVTGNPEP